MAFDFDAVFQSALGEGMNVLGGSSQAARDWLKSCVQANRDTLQSIVEAVATKQISKETGQDLIRDHERTLKAESLALALIIRAAVQQALDAFFRVIKDALMGALKLAF
jgi:hypothetical protein